MKTELPKRSTVYAIVYHDIDGKLVHVATLDCDVQKVKRPEHRIKEALEAAYMKTNHAHFDWQSGPSIIESKTPARSTMVGDRIWLVDGETLDEMGEWTVAGIGFKKTTEA